MIIKEKAAITCLETRTKKHVE